MPWPVPNNVETILSSASLTSGANLISSEYNQQSTRYLYARFGLAWSFGSAPTAGDYIEMYILSRLPDGTNYPDGGTSVDPKDGLIHVWKIDWVDTSTHELSVDHILLPNDNFYVLIKSEAAQTATVTLTMQRYNEPTS